MRTNSLKAAAAFNSRTKSKGRFSPEIQKIEAMRRKLAENDMEDRMVGIAFEYSYDEHGRSRNGHNPKLIGESQLLGDWADQYRTHHQDVDEKQAMKLAKQVFRRALKRDVFYTSENTGRDQRERPILVHISKLIIESMKADFRRIALAFIDDIERVERLYEEDYYAHRAWEEPWGIDDGGCVHRGGKDDDGLPW